MFFADPRLPLRSQRWSEKFVQVIKGSVRFRDSKEGNRDTRQEIQLDGLFVSLQAKRHIRLESPHGVQIFRAHSEAKAYQWLFVISRYCRVPPVAEGMFALRQNWTNYNFLLS